MTGDFVDGRMRRKAGSESARLIEALLSEKYRHFFENVSEQIVFYDREAVPLLYNPSFERFVKEFLNIDMAPGIRVYRFFQGKNREIWDMIYRQLLGGENVRMDCDLTSYNGETRTYDVVMIPLLLAGELAGFCQISRETGSQGQHPGPPQIIGPRFARTLQSLRNTALFSIEGPSAKGGQAEILYAHPSFGTILGVSPPLRYDLCMGKIEPADRLEMEKRAMAAPAGRPFSGLLRVMDGNGGPVRQIYVESIATDPKTGGGRIYDGVVVDLASLAAEIGDRVVSSAHGKSPQGPENEAAGGAQYEKPLPTGGAEPLRLDPYTAAAMDPARLWWLVFEQTETAVLIYDRHGVPVLFNRSYARLFKRAMGIDMRPGLVPHKLLRRGDERQFMADIHRKLLAGENHDMVYTMTFPDGETRSYRCFFNPLFIAGKQEGFTMICRDITGRIPPDIREQGTGHLLRDTSVDPLSQVAPETGADPAASPMSAAEVLKQQVSPLIEQLKALHPNDHHQQRLIDSIEQAVAQVRGTLLQDQVLVEKQLTSTERRVAELIRKGNRSADIAQSLDMSKQTVDTHRKNIRNKLGLRNARKNLRSHLIFLASEDGRLED